MYELCYRTRHQSQVNRHRGDAVPQRPRPRRASEPGHRPRADAPELRAAREGCFLPRKYAAEVDERIAANRTSGKKVRKDAVKLVEGIITASPEFFEGKSEEECRRFFEDAYEFVKAEMGAENMIHFTVHMDETTPHAHWGAVPIRTVGSRGRRSLTGAAGCPRSKTAASRRSEHRGAWIAGRSTAVGGTARPPR